MSTPDNAAAWPRLDKKARVGNRLFGAGVSSRHVVEAAQREYEQRAENKARTLEDLHRLEHNRRALWNLIHGDLLPNPEQGMCQPHGWVNRLPDGFQYRMPPVVINGYQLRQALDFIAPEGLPEQLEETVCIAWRPAEDNLDGERCPAALCCWSAEYPEEGAVPLAWALPVKVQAEPVAGAKLEEAARQIAAQAGADEGEFVAWLLAGGFADMVLSHFKAPAAPGAQPLTPAARDVLAERRRQVEAEGWTPEHDDEHSDGSLALAAACYADKDRPDGMCPGRWPWHASDWKPKDRRADLVRASALILAEIERLDRIAAAGEKGGA